MYKMTINHHDYLLGTKAELSRIVRKHSKLKLKSFTKEELSNDFSVYALMFFNNKISGFSDVKNII